MFGFGKKASNLINTARNKDALEAASAVIALMAGADGDLNDDEIDEGVDSACDMKLLRDAGYDRKDIEDTLKPMMRKARREGGQTELLRELRDVAKRDGMRDFAEDLYGLAGDVGRADGGKDMGPEEQAMRGKIKTALGL